MKILAGIIFCIACLFSSQEVKAEIFRGPLYTHSCNYLPTGQYQTVGEAVEEWWDVCYRYYWNNAFGNKGPLEAWCGYTYRDAPPNGSSTAVGYITLTGFCQGGGTIWAKAYTYNPEKNLGQQECEIAPGNLCGNPINAATGNKFQKETDASFEEGLEFVRYYNSEKFAPDYFMGPNWTSSYARRVEHVPNTAGTTYETASVLRPDGKKIKFILTAGVWTPDTDIYSTLERLSDPITGNIVGWIFQESRGGVIESFDNKGRLSALDFPDGNRVDLMYNNGVIEGNESDYLLTSLTSRSGRKLVLSYAAGRLSNIQGPDGSLVSYAYDTNGRLSSVQHPGGAIRTYIYNEAVNTSNANLPFALTGIEDESANRFATFQYKTDGKVFLTKHGNGVDTHSVQFSNSTSSIVTFPDGATQGRVFSLINGIQRPTRVSKSVNGVTKFEYYTYDSTGRIDTHKDFSGTTFDYDFDGNGLLTQRRDGIVGAAPPSRTEQTDWNAAIRKPIEKRVYDSGGALLSKSTWSYNSRGQSASNSFVDPQAGSVRVTGLTYCEQPDVASGDCPFVGLLTSVDGPRTDVADTISYTYYADEGASCASSPTTCLYHKGDLWKSVDALGHVTETLAYDGAGRPLSIKDPNGIVTDFTYHPRGWLTTRKVRGPNNAAETDDQITTIEYWPTGLVKKVTQPDGAFTSYTYDAAHRLTDIADNAGNTIHYTLDNAGNRTAEETKDTGGVLRRSLSRVYNQLGQLQTAKDAYNHATGFTYDANGNNQTVTDALGRVADNDYDPLNRLVRTLQDVGGIEAETKFEYDAQDNLTKVTDPKGLDTTYQYNGFGDLVQLSSPDTGVTTYTYDSAGNRKTQTDARGITATYSYDALNRLTGIAYPTSSLDVAYIYDAVNAACTTDESFAIGRLARMTDGSGETQYCYDRFGNLTRKRQITNGQTFELRYAYTLAGQVQAITYPDGAVVDYVRDGQGRTTEIGVTKAGDAREILLNQITYYPFGPIAGWTYGNGRTITRTLNQNYQPVAIEDPNAGGLSLGYAFDEVGNLKKLYNADQSVIKAQYGYDALNRLTDVMDGPTGTVIDHYAYDATGNRTSFTNAGGTTDYTYPMTSHRLSQVGVIPRSYDAAGNTTQIGGATKEFVYNDANRMAQVKVSGAVAMNYALNGRGEQVRKHLNVSNTYTVYNEASQWLADYDANENPIQQVIWLDTMPVGLFSGAAANQELHYLQPDYLGTPRVVIDAIANTAIWRWDLEGEVYGNTIPNQDPDVNGAVFVLNMRYPGQRYDAVSGLNYNFYRDYDAASGRYTESDPIGLEGGIATYRYVRANPLLYVDSLGLQNVHIPGPVPVVINQSQAQSLVAYGTSPGYQGAQAQGITVPSPLGCPMCGSAHRLYDAYGKAWWEVTSSVCPIGAEKLAARLADIMVDIEKPLSKLCTGALMGMSICNGKVDAIDVASDILERRAVREEIRRGTELAGQKRVGTQSQRP